MADISLPFNILNNTDADATEPEGNFNVIESYLNTEVIRRDGAVAMLAQLSLFTDPVAPNDAVRKAYADALVPVGVVMPYGGVTTPGDQWMICDGTSLSTTAYPTLFAVLQYRFGGTGGSFNLPDLRTRMPVGWHPTTAPFTVAGATGGSKDQGIPAHSHGMNNHVHSIAHVHSIDHDHGVVTSTSNGDHSHKATSDTSLYVYDNNDTGNTVAAGAVTILWRQLSTVDTNTTGAHTHSVDVPTLVGVNTGASSAANSGAAAGTTETSGVSATDQNLPPYVVMNFIIKVA